MPLYLVYKRILNIPRKDERLLIDLEPDIICTASKKGFFNIPLFVKHFNEVLGDYCLEAII